MSLEIIEYNTSTSNESELLATIKQRTGLEMEAVGSEDYGIKPFNIRFPDMETAQKVGVEYINTNGTFFIDVDNHFLCHSLVNGTSSSSYVDAWYRNLIFDSNGKLVNICYTSERKFNETMNTGGSSNNYAEDDHSKSNITLCPLRCHAYNSLNQAFDVRAFVKNCYVNYERRFQRNLKFIDQNGNRFVTLGGYLLYKVD